MTTAKQRRIMEALHTKAALDPAQEVAFRVQFLKDYLLSSRRNGFVLSISGGQDSALAGRLCQLAVDEDELTISYKVIDDYLEGKDVPEEVAQRI